MALSQQMGAPPLQISTNSHWQPRAPLLLTSRLANMEYVRTPNSARWLARVMIAMFIIFPFLLIFLPWQQSFHATGRVVAFDPTERQQSIEAPVDGRISQWYVQEGTIVTAGQKLVSIQDPDPLLPERLREQKKAIEGRIKAARERIDSFSQQIIALEASQTQAIEGAKSRLSMSREREKAADQAVVAAKARVRLEVVNFRMENDLRRDGLTSQLNFEAAKARREQADAELERAINSLNAARDEVKALEADLGTIKNNAAAAIASAKASRQSADAELASGNRDLQDIECRIARQDTQDVTAPSDGVVYRIMANAHQGGALVKTGEQLAIITPTIRDLKQRTVELYLSGNDAPQVMRLMRDRGKEAEIPVRIQFEGWPAIQFVGWPSVAWGTFGGKVVFVDPHDDGKGRFRVLVEQDDSEEPWPDAESLRQGTRAQGWVLLNEVPLGYELWRRFNGFPPVESIRDEGELKAKPPKAKVPK